MALFSDIDWIIVVGVGAFLLLGPESGTTVRQLGRWYGRAVRLKQELLNEVARAAETPLPAGGAPGSIRAALLGLEGAGPPRVGIPAPVRTPPGAPRAPPLPCQLPTTGGYPVTSWSMTFFGPAQEPREPR